MKAKIDSNIICIPPYVSASWDQVTFIQTRPELETNKLVLQLHLADGREIEIPNLDPAIIDIVFSSHLKHLEQRKGNAFPMPEQISGLKIGLGMPGMESLTDVMSHDQSKADAPDIPKEVLEKISGVARMVTGGELEAFPKPEPHCNCTHCQLARAIHGQEAEELEPVTEEDLTFRSWEIKKSGDNLYTVTNPIDSEEHYNVFLGTPVGCTCGHPHCEHIKAVLSS